MTNGAHICSYCKSKVQVPLLEGVFLFFQSTFDVLYWLPLTPYFMVGLTLCLMLMWCGSFPRPGTVLTVQALSEDDHKFWMQAMGGKEPVSQLPALCHHLSLTLGSCSPNCILFNSHFIVSFNVLPYTCTCLIKFKNLWRCLCFWTDWTLSWEDLD